MFASCANKISVATELNCAPNVCQYVLAVEPAGGVCPVPGLELLFAGVYDNLDI